MVLEAVGASLVACESATPVVQPGEVLLRVEACGVCRTELHVVDGGRCSARVMHRASARTVSALPRASLRRLT